MKIATDQGHPAPSHLPTHHAQHHDPESARWALAQEEEARRAEQERVRARHAYFYAGGRALVALLFIGSAIAKIASFEDTRSAMAGLGLSAASFLLTSAILIELVGGTLVAIGYGTRRAAAALIAYLAAVTIFVVAYVNPEVSRFFVLANLGFASGLVMLVAHGTGSLSVQKVLERRELMRERA